MAEPTYPARGLQQWADPLKRYIDGADDAMADLAVEQVAADLADPTSELGARQMAAVDASALQDFVAKCDTGAQDISLLLLSDSTNMWLDQARPMIAARFPHLNISYAKWTDGNPGSYSAPVVTPGTGPRTLHIWNASVAGKTWQYHFDATRMAPMLVTPNPDAVVVSLGHNDNPAGVQSGGSLPGQRSKALVFIEQMRAALPNTAVALMSQNPLLEYDRASQVRADMLRTLARTRGLGFIDVCKAFTEDPRPLTDLVSTDRVHPTAGGYALWAARFMQELNVAGAGRVSAQLPSSFLTSARNLLNDPTFANYDGTTTPSGLAVTNATLSKDTTNFETGSWALKITKTAPGATSFIDMQANVPVALLRSKVVTVVARLRIPSTFGSTVGQVTARFSAATPGSELWQQGDQFFYRAVTAVVPAGSTVVAARLMVDPSNGANLPEVTLDRWGLFLGDLPVEPLP